MKTKLNLKFALLLLTIIILTLMSAYYNFSIENDSENILKANYKTLEYSRNMLLSLDEIHSDKEKSIAVFEANLTKQMGNITEVGEDKATYKLKSSFDNLKKNWTDENLKSQIRQNIFEILKLNTVAIKKKSNIVKDTAEAANFWITITGTFCFLIGCNLMINLPNRKAKLKRSHTKDQRDNLESY